MSTAYRVYFTIRNGRSSYGAESEVTDKVRLDGLPVIKRSIDSTDFEFGVYRIDDLTLKCFNINGEFNDEFDSRSRFKYGRDRTKVRVVFSNTDGDSIVFRGFIDDDATKQDADNDSIDFRVLSRDSVLRTTKVAGGVVSAGMFISDAIYAILNSTEVTAFLNVSALNINPNLDIAVDSETDLSGDSIRNVLNRLLLASNSVMLIDSSDNVIVRGREANEENPALLLYGPFDIKRRTNVIRLEAYNPGRHKTFTSVKINNTERTNADYAYDYGYRRKSISLAFISDVVKETSIADRLVDEFKFPKAECWVEVPTYVASGFDLLDPVSFNYPLRVKPSNGGFLPVIGVTKIGETDQALPAEYGSLSIDPNVMFKIIEIQENPRDFTTRLKLRQTGTATWDGYFAKPGSCIIGFAKIGDGTICDGGSVCNAFAAAPLGAAKIGCTEVA